MATEQPKVVIFDDFISGDRFPYRDCAAEAATEAGWIPRVFGTVRPAERYLDIAGEDVRAVVSSLGRKENGTFTFQFPAMPLLHLAKTLRKPIALLSGHSNAERYINPGTSDIVVPKHPYEQIAPALSQWFSQLMSEPAPLDQSQ